MYSLTTKPSKFKPRSVRLGCFSTQDFEKGELVAHCYGTMRYKAMNDNPSVRSHREVRVADSTQDSGTCAIYPRRK